MKFNSKTVTISVGDSVKDIFEKFDRIRPNDISFSHFLALAVHEYLDRHVGINAKLTEFSDESVDAKLPLFLASLERWKECIPNLSSDDFRKVQQRHVQIGNIVNKEVNRRL